MTDLNDATAIVLKLKTDGLITQAQIDRLAAAATTISTFAKIRLFEIAQICDEAIRLGVPAETVVVQWEVASTDTTFYWMARAIRGR